MVTVLLAKVGEVASDVTSRLKAAVRFRLQPLQVGQVNFGDLRRIEPISRWFGFDRGLPVDRSYVESFLQAHASDIHGRVLEVGDDAYTKMFGKDRVALSEVLHIDPAASNVTYVADLTDGKGVPDAAFDCVVLTQTLHLIYDMPAAVRTLHRILKPGGVLLVTVPGVSSVDQGEWGETWFWSLTPSSLSRLLKVEFGEEAVTVETFGNVMTAVAFLHGLATSELSPEEIAFRDPQYPVIVAARVHKR
jgi:SAM-dependent methyltransferase